MVRAIWTGSISFGLVNVPVKVFSAVNQHDIRFNQFDKRGHRIHLKRVAEKTGREVEYKDIVKGYEVARGKFVMIDPEELDAYRPRTTRTIDIEDFVALEEIDPIYYEHTYYLAPASDEAGGAKAYQLLLESMERQKKVGIGKVVMRTKQYLAAIRPLDGVLAMSTMLFADEVVAKSEVPGIPKRKASVSDREVKLASQIIDSLTTDWKPERYKDTYRRQVLELIKRKAAGKEIVAREEEEPSSKVVDLMAALEESLAAAKRGRGRPAKKSAKRGGTKRGTTRSAARSNRTRKSA
jgi:DNA end-binding protein Ku